jgi:hypothetical protein
LGRFVPELSESAEIIRYLAQEGEAFCIIEADWYQRLGGLTGRVLPILARQDFDRVPLLLISNR